MPNITTRITAKTMIGASCLAYNTLLVTKAICSDPCLPCVEDPVTIRVYMGTPVRISGRSSAQLDVCLLDCGRFLAPLSFAHFNGFEKKRAAIQTTTRCRFYKSSSRSRALRSPTSLPSTFVLDPPWILNAVAVATGRPCNTHDAPAECLDAVSVAARAAGRSCKAPRS